MIQCKLMCAMSILVLFLVYAGAVPIAMSQISTNFPVANAIIDGQETSPNWVDAPSSYVKLESDVLDVPAENDLVGNGIISLTVPGAMVSAESNDAMILNTAQVALEQHYANLHSETSTRFFYDVENVSSIAFSLDITASMNLQTDNQQESVYGYLDEFLGLYEFDGTNFNLINQDEFTIEENSPGYMFNGSHTLNLLRNFENGPFSGQLMIQGISTANARAEITPTPTSVPEPTMLSLIAIGLVSLVCMRKKVF